MLQHFNLEIFTDNVKTTSLFKTAPLKVSALSSEFILALFRHQRSSHTSWHLPSCIVWCSLSYRDTGGRQHCPAAPWQYEVRQGRSWEQTHKKKKRKTQQPHDRVTPAPWGHLKGQQYWITVWSQRSEGPEVDPSQTDGGCTCTAEGGRRRSPV